MPSYPPNRYTGEPQISSYDPGGPDNGLYTGVIYSGSLDIPVTGTSQSFDVFADTFAESQDDSEGAGIASTRIIRGSIARTPSFLAYQASIQSK